MVAPGRYPRHYPTDVEKFFDEVWIFNLSPVQWHDKFSPFDDKLTHHHEYY